MASEKGDIFIIQESNLNYAKSFSYDFLKKNYEDLIKDYIPAKPDSFVYLLLLHILGLEGISEIPNIDIKGFTRSLQKNGTLEGLIEILSALFRPLSIIISNPAPATINIIIDSPTQLDLDSYKNQDGDEYLNNPTEKTYKSLQLSNLNNTTNNSFENILKLFIPIGTHFEFSTIPFQEIDMPDSLLRAYVLNFFNLDVENNKVVLSMLISDVISTFDIDNVNYTSLVGLELATGIKDLSILKISETLDLSPVYNLALDSLLINNNADANLFISKSYKEVTLINTSTLLLDFLADNTNLETLIIESEIGILDFRPLVNCTSLTLLDCDLNFLNETINATDDYEVTFDCPIAYNIDGTEMAIDSISGGGVFLNNIISWENVLTADDLIVVKKGNASESITYVIKPIIPPPPIPVEFEDELLRQYVLDLLSKPTDYVLTDRDLKSPLLANFDIDNLNYTSLVGLEYALGMKNLNIINISETLSLSPIYNLALENLVISSNSDANLFTSKSYKEVNLLNTSTLLLNFLSNNTNLETLTIESEIGILDFRPLATCTSLNTLTSVANYFNISIDVVGGVVTFDCPIAYNIDGTEMAIDSISANGSFLDNIVTWENITTEDDLIIVKQGNANEKITYVIKPTFQPIVVEFEDELLKQYIIDLLGLTARIDITDQDLKSPLLANFDIDNVNYTSLVGLEYALGIKNLNIINISETLDLSPVYNLQLDILNISTNSDANLFTSKSYKEVNLINTSTSSLNFLSNNTNLETLTIESEIGILDFRPLATCSALVNLNCENNNYNVPEILEEEAPMQYSVDILTTYNIDGTNLIVGEISNNGTFASGKITWQNLDVPNGYIVSYKLIEGALMVNNSLNKYAELYLNEISKVSKEKLDASSITELKTFDKYFDYNDWFNDESWDSLASFLPNLKTIKDLRLANLDKVLSIASNIESLTIVDRVVDVEVFEKISENFVNLKYLKAEGYNSDEDVLNALLPLNITLEALYINFEVKHPDTINLLNTFIKLKEFGVVCGISNYFFTSNNTNLKSLESLLLEFKDSNKTIIEKVANYACTHLNNIKKLSISSKKQDLTSFFNIINSSSNSMGVNRITEGLLHLEMLDALPNYNLTNFKDFKKLKDIIGDCELKADDLEKDKDSFEGGVNISITKDFCINYLSQYPELKRLAFLPCVDDQSLVDKLSDRTFTLSCVKTEDFNDNINYDSITIDTSVMYITGIKTGNNNINRLLTINNLSKINRLIVTDNNSLWFPLHSDLNLDDIEILEYDYTLNSEYQESQLYDYKNLLEFKSHNDLSFQVEDLSTLLANCPKIRQIANGLKVNLKEADRNLKIEHPFYAEYGKQEAPNIANDIMANNEFVKLVKV